MDTMEKLHNITDYKNLAYYQKGSTVNVDFNNFIEAVTFFDEIKSSRMKLADADKNQMEFKSKLSHIRIGGEKSDKQENEIRNTANLYHARKEVIKLFKGYPTMMPNARYDATHEKEIKIIIPKRILQRLPIALAQADKTSKK